MSYTLQCLLISNRTNSKATVRLAIKDLSHLTPSIIHEALVASQYYAAKSEALIVQADSSRSQSDNVEECFRKLYQNIMKICRSMIKGETSPDQVRKVGKLYAISIDLGISHTSVLTSYVQRQKAENESRLRSKKTHSRKKSSRKAGKSDY